MHLERRIDELQVLPATDWVLLGKNVQLPDSTLVTLRHPLGRAPKMIYVSPVRDSASTGRITEWDTVYSNGEQVDRTKFIVLAAYGYGATVRVDVAVM